MPILHIFWPGLGIAEATEPYPHRPLLLLLHNPETCPGFSPSEGPLLSADCISLSSCFGAALPAPWTWAEFLLAWIEAERRKLQRRNGMLPQAVTHYRAIL